MKINKEIILYIIFGIITTLINCICFIILSKFSNNIIMINSISFIICVIFSFIVNKYIVFKSNGNKINETVSFFMLRLISLFVDNISVMLFLNIFLLNNLLAKILSNIIVIILNYLLSKFIIFKKNE